MEDLDAIILSYCSTETVGTLMRALPDHPALASNARMWYERIVMGIHNEHAPTLPPYQRDRTGLLPTDYRSLWYALTSPAYYSYATMTKILNESSQPVRRYDTHKMPNKNALEAALDMTAIRVDDPKEPYRWSDAIISLLAVNVVQFVRENTPAADPDEGLSMKPYGDHEDHDDAVTLPDVNVRMLDWIIPAAASRGCTQLIERLAITLGILVGDQDPLPEIYSTPVLVGQWILSSANYTPETHVLPSHTFDRPPIYLLLPTLTAATVTALWNTYMDEEALESIHGHETATILADSYNEDIANVVTLACRDPDILTAILNVLATLRLPAYIDPGTMLSLVLMSPYREVDDYTTVHMMADWLSEHWSMDTIDVFESIRYDIPRYYAERIKSKVQSRRFREMGLVEGSVRSNEAARVCEDMFDGNVSRVYTSISRATDTKGNAHISLAIHHSQIYINGLLDYDRRTGTSHGERDAIALIESSDMRQLISIIFQYPELGGYDASNRTLSLDLLVTAAQSLPVLTAAYELFSFTMDDGDVLRETRVNAPKHYDEMVVGLSKIADVLATVARDPYSDDNALPWLIKNLATTIPDTLDEWSAMQGWEDVTRFPREEMWMKHVLPSIQVFTNLDPSIRLLQLIAFSSVPAYNSRYHSRYNSLPLDLQRKEDGGLPVEVVRIVMDALKRSDAHKHNEEALGELLPYAWNDAVHEVLDDTRWEILAMAE